MMTPLAVTTILAALLLSPTAVLGHGYVWGVTIGNAYIRTYEMWEGLTQTKPNEIGWSVLGNADEGYVSDPTSPDIICHLSAKNAPSHATIAAGEQMEIHWDHFPHAGPVLTYMANCNGPCETVDKNTLKFFKIDESGLLDWQTAPGVWATNVLLENNYTWTVNIPSDIEQGAYVLRHEAIGLHITGQAQYYPNCMNLVVTGGGASNPAGVPGVGLYKTTDPGITVNIYNKLTSYAIPGPPLYAGAKAAIQSPTPATGPLAQAELEGGSNETQPAAVTPPSNPPPTAAASSSSSSSGPVQSPPPSAGGGTQPGLPTPQQNTTKEDAAGGYQGYDSSPTPSRGPHGSEKSRMQGCLH